MSPIISADGPYYPMARNVEIKARVDDLETLRCRLATLPISGEEHLDQIDTFFRVPQGRLKLREFADRSAELIYYERPDDPGAKVSLYERLPSLERTPLTYGESRSCSVQEICRRARSSTFCFRQ